MRFQVCLLYYNFKMLNKQKQLKSKFTDDAQSRSIKIIKLKGEKEDSIKPQGKFSQLLDSKNSLVVDM